MKSLCTMVALIFTMTLSTAYGHSGGTDKNGCHKEKSTGKRHCH